MTRQLGDGLPNRDPRDSEQGPLKKIRQQAEQPQMGQDDRGEQRQQGDGMNMPSNLQAQQQRQGQLHQQMQMSQNVDLQQERDDARRRQMPGMDEELKAIGIMLDEAAKEKGFVGLINRDDPCDASNLNKDNLLTFGKYIFNEIIVKQIAKSARENGRDHIRTQALALVRSQWTKRAFDPTVNLHPVEIQRYSSAGGHG